MMAMLSVIASVLNMYAPAMYVAEPVAIAISRCDSVFIPIVKCSTVNVAAYIAAVSKTMGSNVPSNFLTDSFVKRNALPTFSIISQADATTNPHAIAIVLIGIVVARMMVIITFLIISNLRIMRPLLRTFNTL